MTCNHDWEMVIPNLSNTKQFRRKASNKVMNLYKCKKCGKLMSAEQETIDLMTLVGDSDTDD